MKIVDKSFRSMLALPFLYKHDWSTTVALPKVGCGLGGLDWEEVKAMFIAMLEEDTYEYITATFLVYE